MHPTRRAAPVNIYCFNRLDVNYTSADLSARIESSEISRGDGRGRATDLSKRTPSFMLSADWIERVLWFPADALSASRGNAMILQRNVMVLTKSYNIDPPTIYIKHMRKLI